jgi:ribonuclease R
VGQRSGKKFRMGDKVWIKVVAANLTKRQLDYEWVVAGELIKTKTEEEVKPEKQKAKKKK